MQFVERLAQFIDDERWLVESNGVTRVAWFIDRDGDNPDWLARTQEATRPVHGAIHPRICAIHSSTLYDKRLVFEVDDDRGPYLVAAAAQLADPVERERWTVAQVIGLADAIAAVRAREPAFAARLEPDGIFIDEAGHARLHAPVIRASRPVSTRTGPMPRYWAMPYLAPEQLQREPASPASTVFSLATCLAHAIAGARPFRADDGGDYMGEMVRVITEPPHPIPTQTPALAGVFARAFVKDPASRLPDTAAFAAELRAAIPDAADYDAVVSDRIVAWRPTVTEPKKQFEDVPCQQRWDQLPATSDEIRWCDRCDEQVVQIRASGAPIPVHGWSCRPKR